MKLFERIYTTQKNEFNDKNRNIIKDLFLYISVDNTNIGLPY